MTFDEAHSEAVLGARITSQSIQVGAFVDYQFNGLRIVFPSGSHSGFSPTEADRNADWNVVPMGFERFAPKRDKWGRAA